MRKCIYLTLAVVMALVAVMAFGTILTGCSSLTQTYHPSLMTAVTDTGACISLELRDTTGRTMTTFGPFCYTYRELMEMIRSIRGDSALPTPDAIPGNIESR